MAKAWEDTNSPDPECLAIHYHGAGDLERAARLTLEAAERAALVFGFERAVRVYTSALSLGKFDPRTLHRIRVARADVLAQAGRSLEAAEACGQAMVDADPEQERELRLRAGGFYLQCGRLEEALPLINQGLAPFDLSIATTNSSAIASMMWERTRLKLRGYKPRAGPKDPEAVQRFAAGEVISAALPSLDPIRYPSLATRLLRIALDSGDPALVARGLASEVLVGLMLAHPDDKLRKVAEQAKQACAVPGQNVGGVSAAPRPSKCCAWQP